MGSQRPVGREREWSFAAASFLLFTVSLLAFRRTRKVNMGLAAGFLLQGFAGALGAILGLGLGGSSRGWGAGWHRQTRWACSVLGLPLLSFGYHWSSGERAAANALLSGGVVAAALSGPAGPAASAVAAAAPLSMLATALLTADGWACAGSLALLLAAALRPPYAHTLLTAAGVAALQRALDARRQAARTVTPTWHTWQ
ncbi:transmembrane protein 276-like [Rhinoraja longicauda]